MFLHRPERCLGLVCSVRNHKMNSLRIYFTLVKKTDAIIFSTHMCLERFFPSCLYCKFVNCIIYVFISHALYQQSRSDLPYQH